MAFDDHQKLHSFPTRALPISKDLPVVVNPHGGPWARDSWGFNPEIQFLANRGYAVFRSEEHTSELQSRENLVCRLLLEKKNYIIAPCNIESIEYDHQNHQQ